MIHELLLALNGCHGDIFAYNRDTGMIEVGIFVHPLQAHETLILGCRRVTVYTPQRGSVAE